MVEKLKQRFKPEIGIRKRMQKDMIVVGSMFAITLLLPGLIGRANCTSSTMGVVIVFISTFGDHTLEPVKNIFKLLGGTLGVIFAAFLAYSIFPQGTTGYTVMMTSVTFAAFFLIIYLFQSELRGNFFMPLLLNFSIMIYNPVYGTELIIRVILDLIIVGTVIFFQVTLFKGKFRKQVAVELNAVIGKLKAQIFAMKTYDHREQLMKNSEDITAAINAMNLKVGPRLAQVRKWQHGHDVIRTLHILGRINETLTDSIIIRGEPMTQELYNRLKAMFEAVDDFEKDAIPESEVIRQFDLLIGSLESETTSAETASMLREEATDFVAEEILHSDTAELRGPSAIRRLIGEFNGIKAVFALKTACIAAFGVFISCFFGLENASMYVMTVSVLAQPYTEIGQNKIKLRIIHTFYALGMYLIAFSVSHNTIIHIFLLLAMIFIGDMFIKFETNVIGSTMMMVVIRTINDPGIMWTITAYRIAYVVGAALIILIVDALVFPNRLGGSIRHQLKRTRAATESLRLALYTSKTIDEAHAAVIRKRRANHRLLHVNSFVRNPKVSAYLLADDGWLNRVTMLLHRMKVGGFVPDDLHAFVERASETEGQLTDKQSSVIASLNGVMTEIDRSEQLALAIVQK